MFSLSGQMLPLLTLGWSGPKSGSSLEVLRPRVWPSQVYQKSFSLRMSCLPAHHSACSRQTHSVLFPCMDEWGGPALRLAWVYQVTRSPSILFLKHGPESFAASPIRRWGACPPALCLGSASTWHIEYGRMMLHQFLDSGIEKETAPSENYDEVITSPGSGGPLSKW